MHHSKRFCAQPLLQATSTMKLTPSALLFDMDGVLVDSIDSWWKAVNQSFRNFGQKEITKETFIDKYWGYDLRDNLKRMHLPTEIATFCNTAYSDNIHAVRMYPDTKEALTNLQKYKKGVITNTPRSCARQILEQFDIARYFSVIITSDDVVHAKPSPDIILKACEQLNVVPQDVVVIGDTDSDVKAGRAAGCIVVGKNIKADYSVSSLSELLALLD